MLAHSAAEHCSGWDLNISTLAPSQTLRSALGNQSHVHNTQKLEHWADRIAAADDGDRLLLIDSDTLILRSLDDVWDLPFDLAFTVRPDECLLPFNGGVMFARVTAAVREFFERWRAENMKMLGDRDYHDVWRKRFGGINQAAFGSVMNQPITDIDVLPLPCAEWNCEDFTWKDFSDSTRILHVKGALRRRIFGRRVDADPEIEQLARVWLQAEACAV